MTSCARFAAALLLACAAARGEAWPVHATFGATADDAGGTSLDAGVAFDPGERFSFHLGVGHSSIPDHTGDLSGTLLDLGASLHGERFGVATSFSAFESDSNYRARTVGLRAWIAAGHFDLALLGRHRANDVLLTLDLPMRTGRREVEFTGTGGGLQVGFARGDFHAYVMALRYDYDEELDRFVELANSPQLASRPRIEALVGSFMMQAQGAIDRQAGAGLERLFGRHSLALDVAAVHDAILDSGSVSVALTYRRTRSARVDWSISAGMIDSDELGGTAFAGFEVGLSN
jgi:hypothetical protein